MRTSSGLVLWLVLLPFGQGCSQSSNTAANALPTGSGDTSVCVSHAKTYAEVLLTDARVCDLADGSSCSARRPVVMYEVPSGTIIDGTPPPAYAVAISICPSADSGIAVNPNRTAALDRVLSDYLAAGCNASAGPGCGTSDGSVTGEPPAPRPPPTCEPRPEITLCYELGW